LEKKRGEEIMDKCICKILELSVILGFGIILLVASPFIGVTGANPTGVGSGSGVVAAMEAGMTSLEEEVRISAYANVGEEGMLTYTNEEYGFLIEYPKDWVVNEEYMGFPVLFAGPIKEDFAINVIVRIEELPTMMTADEYAKAGRESFLEEWKIVKTFNDTINGEPVSGHILTIKTEGGIVAKQMQAIFVHDKRAYMIVFSAASSTYDEADEDYFDPMLRSFKFTEKEAGIEIPVFIVTPSKVEAGEEVKIKFEAVNEADVEKTKTFFLIVNPPGTLPVETIDFKTVTLAPGERVEIEFTFIPKETGAHILYVADRVGLISVGYEEEARISVKTPLDVLEGENFTATVTMDNASDLAILLFKLNYDPSVITLNKIEKGSGIATSSWSHWYSTQHTGVVKIFAFFDLSGSPVNGPAELARLEFSAVGSAGDKSALDIQGIIANLDMESLQVIWVDSEVTVIPGA
jgi:hypothetical protein